MSFAASPLEIAGSLASQAGLGPPVELIRLAGGKNNRVFAVGLAGGAHALLKIYHRSANDPRDRLAGEWNFLSYAASRGIVSVAAPLAIDRAAGAALHTFMAGRKLDASEIMAEHVAHALDFIVALNVAPRDDAGLQPASEACFSMVEHIATIDRRMARLEILDEDAPFRMEAEALVRDRLLPLWREMREHALAAFPSPDRPLPAEQRIVSPSDFGFHNVLMGEDGRLSFLDFEYAGIDDPAKLAGDLFSVPEIPTPLQHFGAFAEGLAARLDLGGGFCKRAAALLPVYNVKWICIILNDFLVQGAERRAFSMERDRAERCAAQLAKASAKLSAIPIER